MKQNKKEQKIEINIHSGQLRLLDLLQVLLLKQEKYR